MLNFLAYGFDHYLLDICHNNVIALHFNTIKSFRDNYKAPVSEGMSCTMHKLYQQGVQEWTCLFSGYIPRV